MLIRVIYRPSFLFFTTLVSQFRNYMENIVQDTDDFILKLFSNELPSTFVYHNYTHSKRVHKSINEIIEHSQIDVKDALVLQLAALLHDTGYVKSRENHEQES